MYKNKLIKTLKKSLSFSSALLLLLQLTFIPVGTDITPPDGSGTSITDENPETAGSSPEEDTASPQDDGPDGGKNRN